jgi:hypothetical protein
MTAVIGAISWRGGCSSAISMHVIPKDHTSHYDSCGHENAPCTICPYLFVVRSNHSINNLRCNPVMGMLIHFECAQYRPVRSANERAPFVIGRGHLGGNSEVSKFNMSRLCEKDICSFDVSMDYPLHVFVSFVLANFPWPPQGRLRSMCNMIWTKLKYKTKLPCYEDSSKPERKIRRRTI